ncbi:hypothetical protein D3C79_1102900 [compost metagenome]
MLVTLIEQEQSALASAESMQPGAVLIHYEQAEKTFSFIREEGLRLIDAELSFY